MEKVIEELVLPQITNALDPDGKEYYTEAVIEASPIKG